MSINLQSDSSKPSYVSNSYDSEEDSVSNSEEEEVEDSKKKQSATCLINCGDKKI